MKEKTTCNEENGSRSDLWNRQCWIADSLVSLIDSRITYLREQGNTDPLTDLHRYCEELRVKNGLREPAVLNWDAQFPGEL